MQNIANPNKCSSTATMLFLGSIFDYEFEHIKLMRKCIKKEKMKCLESISIQPLCYGKPTPSHDNDTSVIPNSVAGEERNCSGISAQL
jgi:hypothetical protein